MTRRNRLLFWTRSYWPTGGGGEIWSRSFLQGLQANGWDIQVLAFESNLSETTHAIVDGIDIWRPPMRVGFSTGNPQIVRAGLAVIEEVIRRLDPQCIHINGPSAEALLAYSLVARKLRIPTLVTFHSELFAEEIGAGSLVERIVRRADHISVFDQSMTRWLMQHWPDTADRIHCLPHALTRPIGPWHTAPANGIVAFCGRLSLEKGVDLALAAFARIRHRHPAARLLIAGDGDQRSALAAQARDLGIEDRVTFKGWVDHDDVERILDDCAFAIMPSRLESFGLYALEAAERGRAVVAAAVGGLPSHVKDGETGLLVPFEDVGGLAEAMSALLSDPDLAVRLGAAGRGQVERRPDWQAHLAAHEALLDRMIAEAEVARP